MVGNKRNLSRKIKKLICAFITLFMFVSGMCFDEIRTDSLFASASSERDTFLSSGCSAFTDEQACTVDMLGIRGTAELGRITVRAAVQKRDEKASSDFLCQKISVPTEGKSYISSDGIQFISEFSDEHIVNYLHRSDGKKRI